MTSPSRTARHPGRRPGAGTDPPLGTSFPVQRTQWTLPSGTAASPAARRHVTTVTNPLDRDVAYAAGSLTSEIVTAVLLRGRTEDMWLEVAVSEDTMRVDVTASFPRRRLRLVPRRGPGSRGGLLILDALAADWGVAEGSSPTADSLRIWFRLGLN